MNMETTPDVRETGRAPERSRIDRFLLTVYAGLLRLYPGSFRDLFGAEMQEVFTAALQDAAQKGGAGRLRLLARELLPLPTLLFAEYFSTWRQTMLSSPPRNEIETSIARWAARLLTLLLALFSLSLFLFNDDVRAAPAFPLLLLLGLSLGLLSGWAAPRAAAWVGVVGGPLLAASVLLHGRTLSGTVNWPLLLALAVALALPFMLIAWLFASVHYVQTVQRGDPLPSPRPRWLLLIVMAVLAALLLFGASWLTPVSTEISAPSFGNTDIDAVANALRARGAVIGISSQPVEQSAFAVPGTVLLVDEAELWLFAYDDVAAATADAAAIYRGEREFSGTDLIQQGNLLLAFPQADAQTRALLTDLFGPPIGTESE